MADGESDPLAGPDNRQAGGAAPGFGVRNVPAALMDVQRRARQRLEIDGGLPPRGAGQRERERLVCLCLLARDPTTVRRFLANARKPAMSPTTQRLAYGLSRFAFEL